MKKAKQTSALKDPSLFLSSSQMIKILNEPPIRYLFDQTSKIYKEMSCSISDEVMTTVLKYLISLSVDSMHLYITTNRKGFT